jgi:hypothetical protein
MAAALTVSRMAGPCANGWERNGGTRWHLLINFRAACGARCNSFWSDEKGEKVTCPRCLAKLRTMAAGGTVERAFGQAPSEITRAARELLAKSEAGHA